MGLVRGWSTTLAKPSLLKEPLVLRPMKISDARAYRKARKANDAWLRPWDASTPGGPLQPSLARRLISLIRRSPVGPYAQVLYNRLGALRGMAAYWVIWYDGEFAGEVTVFRVAWGALRSAELGYWIDERLAGRGITPTALAMVVDHCFLVMQLHRLEAYIQPENAASRRAVEKLGFRNEGLRVGHLYVNGTWRDHVCYALTSDEASGGLLSRWRESSTFPQPSAL